MKKHELEQRIRTAVEHAAPNQLDSILSSCDQIQNTTGAPVQEQKKGTIYMTQVNKSQNRRKSGLVAIAALAAVFALCIGGFGLFLNDSVPAVDSVIMLDVNPSLSISVDSSETVISVEALNDDAKEVLGNMDLKDTSLEVAVNAIIGSMLQKGYLGDLQNAILVSVENADAARGEKLQEKVSQAIANALQSGNLDGAILTQTVSGDDASLAELAKQYSISMGKAALIQEVIAQDPTLTFEDLSSMTINEIALIASSKDFSSDSITQSGTASDKAYITREEALNLACAHAGIAVADIQKFEVEFDSDHGIMIYEVEFETETQKFEYDLNATTGEILEFESHDKGSHTGSDTSTGSSDTSGSAYIGETAAKAAALTHAGVSESETYYIKCYVEYKDHQPAYYTVEFETALAEYEYEIDLYTGAVLDADRDAKGSGSTTPSSSSTGSTSYIGEAAAKAAALAHAGVSESSTYYIECYLDYENGKPACYGVKFGTASAKYEYEIDLYTGAVLESSKEAQNSNSGSTNSSGTTANANYIGETAALAKALAHAGVAESSLTEKRVELDEHHNTMVYEIAFETSNAEYDYLIDAVTGEILEAEQDTHH